MVKYNESTIRAQIMKISTCNVRKIAIYKNLHSKMQRIKTFKLTEHTVLFYF